MSRACRECGGGLRRIDGCAAESVFERLYCCVECGAKWLSEERITERFSKGYLRDRSDLRERRQVAARSSR